MPFRQRVARHFGDTVSQESRFSLSPLYHIFALDLDQTGAAETYLRSGVRSVAQSEKDGPSFGSSSAFAPRHVLVRKQVLNSEGLVPLCLVNWYFSLAAKG